MKHHEFQELRKHESMRMKGMGMGMGGVCVKEKQETIAPGATATVKFDLETTDDKADVHTCQGGHPATYALHCTVRAGMKCTLNPKLGHAVCSGPAGFLCSCRVLSELPLSNHPD